MEKALAIQSEVQRILGTDEVYLVGGSVRDLVLGNEPKDYDFTTPMLPADMALKVKKAGRRVYTIGEKFGTIGFKVPVDTLHPTEPFERVEYEYVEVTTFRSEVYTGKSRKPEVQFVPSLDEDLARRDFTFNAMVIKSDGTIYDPYGGRLDILAKRIKTVGTPKDRIIEDPLRMLRAARFAARFGFTVDPNMIGRMRQLGYKIGIVSKERWVIELDKLLDSDNVAAGLQVLIDSEVLKYILPEVWLFLVNYDSDRVHRQAIIHDIKEAKDLNQKWQTLFYFIGYPFAEKMDNHGTKYINHEVIRKELTEGICSRLRFSNDRRDYLLGKHKGIDKE